MTAKPRKTRGPALFLVSGYVVPWHLPCVNAGDMFERGSICLPDSGGLGVPMFWDHRRDRPIGHWLAFEDRPGGLWGQGVILGEPGRRCIAGLNRLGHCGLSIGYYAQSIRAGEQIDPATGVRPKTIVTSTLTEVSLVKEPAYRSSVGHIVPCTEKFHVR